MFLQYAILLLLNMSIVNWLDPTKSLNAQGVTSGDTVLIRYIGKN